MNWIDVHNHYYPPAYIDALQRGPSNVKIVVDKDGNPQLHYPGDYNVAVRGHRDIEYRAQVLGEEGVRTQIISLTTPGTHVEEPKRAIELARLVNDAFADVQSRFGTTFIPYATLPLNDPAASARELERCMRELKFPGAMLFSNVNGVMLDDPRFDDLYDVANRNDAVLHIHPTNPVSVEQMQRYWLMPLVGFLFDTTLAAASLVFRGIPERYPRVRWVLSHLGGAIPYLAERLDRGFEAFAECREFITRPPSTYLKQFYYDTVNFDVNAIRLAVEFAGAEHVLAGSDYPHQIGSIAKMREAVRALQLSGNHRDLIAGGNSERLLSVQ
jgi:aminocarboxymuconate-semialdehyde decarboxylase